VEHGSTSPDSQARRDAVEHGSTGPDSDESTDCGPSVTVTVGGTDEGFYVADDGPGIPPEEREDVFDTGYTTENGGTGLGLAIVSQIVAAHGWEITITDSDSGGARFEITGVDTIT
jgi:signal transduction histidine kinase